MRHRYPEGAIGVDSPYNPFSEVHAEKRSIRENKEVGKAKFGRSTPGLAIERLWSRTRNALLYARNKP